MAPLVSHHHYCCCGEPRVETGGADDGRHPSGVPPLAGPGPTIFLTVVGVGAGLAVWHLVDRLSAEPKPLFRGIVVTALILSLIPDVWLLTEGAAEAFPGATIPAVVTLMVQHVLAAFVVVWTLTMRTHPA